jgi:hypothetical protein
MAREREAEAINMKEQPSETPTPPPKDFRRQKLLEALLVEPDVQTASKTAGVGRSTAHRWLKDAAFQNQLAQQRDTVFSESMATVKAHAVRALSELAKLLTSEDERLRRQVCNDILGHALKVREMMDFENRLAALEKANNKKEQETRHEDEDPTFDET